MSIARNSRHLEVPEDEHTRPSYHRRSRKSWRSIGRSNPRLKAPGRFEQLFLGLLIGAVVGFIAGWLAHPPTTVIPPEPPSADPAQRQYEQSVKERAALENIRSLNESALQRNAGNEHLLLSRPTVEPGPQQSIPGLPGAGSVPPPQIPDDTRYPIRIRSDN